jgi:hypothetical protein
MATLPEKLRDEFYAWEQLGRGELVWNSEVLPEPYFVPFFGHGAFLERSSEPFDDGSRPGPLSWLTGPPMESYGAKPEADPSARRLLEPIETAEPPEYLLDRPGECVEFALTPSRDVNWPPRNIDRFLFAASARDPVCFEYRANAECLDLRLVVPASSRHEVAAVFAHELPDTLAEVEPEPMQLARWLLDPELETMWMRELALQREFFFPILTPQEIERDPHVALLSAFDDLEGGERVVIQVRFQPCVNPWPESIFWLVTMDDGKPFFSGGGDFIAAAKAKLRRPLFAATLRVAVIDTSGERTEQILRRLAAGFAPYEGPNAFVLADEFEQEPAEELHALVHRKSRRSGMLLNSDELAGLVHLPAMPAGHPRLRRILHHTREAPAEHRTRKSLLLGHNRHQGEEHEVGLSIPERCRHIHVIGASGTGKSTFLLQSVLQDLDNGHGMALLDPHGDLVEAVLDRMPESRIGDVVMFDPADADHPIGFNILGAHSEIERTLLASDFVAIFERLSSSWGDQMTAVLGNAALAFLESERGGTLLDLRRFLVEKGFRENYLRSVRDPEVIYFWKHEFPLLKGNTRASLVTRINSFLRQKLIRNMVAQDGKRFDVGRLMNEGKVILAPLAQGLIGEENSWLLGSLLVSKFYQAALSRQELAEEDRRPFWLYLDEAHRFLTPSIASILSGARKYGLGLVLAHQELDQFGSQERSVLSSILTNCLTRVAFRLGDQDAKKLADGFAHFSPDELRQLEIGKAVCRIGGSDRDFNLAIDRPGEPSSGAAELRKRAVAHSRECYATPREEIERTLYGDHPALEPEVQAPAETPPASRARPAKRVRQTEPPPSTVEETEEAAATDAVEPEIPEAEEPPPAPPVESKKPGLPGRGGTHHKNLQQEIKRFANGLGLRATIEATLPDGAGSVDVLVEGSGIRIAFEVALHSPIDQEIRNLQKSLEFGIERIVTVSDESSHLAEIRSAAEAQISAEKLAAVRFMHWDDLGDLFAELGAALASEERVSRGYRVTTRYVAGEGEDRDLRVKAIHRTVAENQLEEQ